MRHIHADHMIAAANDTTIQWDVLDAGVWQEISSSSPLWWSHAQYRQRPTPHPHQAMMDQAKADPSIEWQLLTGLGCWIDCIPGWSESWQYRQRPKMVDLWQWARKERGIILASTSYFADADEAQAAFQGIVLCRIEGSKISVEVSQ